MIGPFRLENLDLMQNSSRDWEIYCEEDKTEVGYLVHNKIILTTRKSLVMLKMIAHQHNQNNCQEED